MSSRIILFTGAPLSSSLNWQHPDLLDHFTEPFSRFSKIEKTQDVVDATLGAPLSIAYPAWRYIPLEREHLKTGLSQNHAWQEKYQGASFFTTNSFIEEMSQLQYEESPSQPPIIEATDQVLSQFYEQSYAVHEDIPSSQLLPSSDMSTSINSESSYGLTESSLDSPCNSFSGPKTIPVAGHLTNLINIPNSTYLSSIHPQTMTVDLIVGIISIPSPRSIQTRRGAAVKLIEMLAGDETKSGFGINFWLPPEISAGDDLRSVLTGLRPQDIILVQNVALSSFRGKVYGQSLRKNMTKAYLLYRNKLDKSDLGGCYKASDFDSNEPLNLQMQKTSKTRDWVLKFVGGPNKGKGRINSMRETHETLPPDTQ